MVAVPQKITLDITTKNALESFHIDPQFTGKIILNFNQGGFSGAVKEETLRKVKQLK